MKIKLKKHSSFKWCIKKKSWAHTVKEIGENARQTATMSECNRNFDIK